MAAPTKEQVKELFDVHNGVEATGARLREAKTLDTTRTWVDANGYRLSDRLWQSKKWTRDQIDQTLRLALASGEDALVTARKLEQFLNPAFAPIRTKNGRLVRNQPRSIVTRTPGRGGSGSYPARRLARTEISRAHAQATAFAARRTPFARGMKWNLSSSHPEADECDAKAHRENGLGEGVYEVRDFPIMPSHPHCLCVTTVVTKPNKQDVINDLRAKYGLGPPIKFRNFVPPEPTPFPVPKPTPFPEPIQQPLPFEPIEQMPFGNRVPEAEEIVSRQQADEFLKAHDIEYVNLQHIEAIGNQSRQDDLMISIANALKDVEAQVGTKMNVGQIGFAHDGSKGEYIAKMIPRAPDDPRRNFLLINVDEGWWQNGNVWENWIVGQTDREFFHHEFYHSVDFDVIGEKYKAPLSRVSNYNQSILSLGRVELTDAEKAIAKQISNYAATIQAEYKAETFTHLMGGRAISDEALALYKDFDGIIPQFRRAELDAQVTRNAEVAARTAKQDAARAAKEAERLAAQAEQERLAAELARQKAERETIAQKQAAQEEELRRAQKADYERRVAERVAREKELARQEAERLARAAERQAAKEATERAAAKLDKFEQDMLNLGVEPKLDGFTLGELTSAEQEAAFNAMDSMVNSLKKMKDRDLEMPKLGRLARAEENKGAAWFSASSKTPSITANITDRIWIDDVLMERQHSVGWLVAENREDLITHEFGHWYDFIQSGGREAHAKTYGPNAKPNDFDVFSKFLDNWRRKLSDAEKEVARKVSRYAEVDRGEFMAETFTQLAESRVVAPDVLAMYRDLGGFEFDGGVAKREAERLARRAKEVEQARRVMEDLIAQSKAGEAFVDPLLPRKVVRKAPERLTFTPAKTIDEAKAFANDLGVELNDDIVKGFPAREKPRSTAPTQSTRRSLT